MGLGDPSSWDKEMAGLRARIEARLNLSANEIVKDEIGRVLGRVKVFREYDMRDPRQYHWFIEPANE